MRPWVMPRQLDSAAVAQWTTLASQCTPGLQCQGIRSGRQTTLDPGGSCTGTQALQYAVLVPHSDVGTTTTTGTQALQHAVLVPRSDVGTTTTTGTQALQYAVLVPRSDVGTARCQ
jgi:hypothetical protein